MSKTKIGILSLIIAAAICLAAGLCFAFVPAHAAAVSPSGVFSLSGGAERTDYSDMQQGQNYYLTYKLPSDGASVNFQRNLALKWYGFENEEPEGGYTLDSTTEAKYFSLTLHLRDLNFQTFTMTMESTQMSQSKEGKTVNEIVFTNNNGTLTASVNGGASVNIPVSDNTADIEIGLYEDTDKIGYGDFVVSINDEMRAGEFTNIGLYYARYASSSSDTPILPLSFTAEGVAESGTSFEVRQLNGQSFLLTENNEITDDTAPVVVANTEIKQFLMGDKNFLDSDNYTVIDVCSSSRTPTLYYYIQNPAEADAEAAAPALTKGENGYELTGYTEADTDQVFFENNFSGNEGYISVAFELSDNNGNTMFAFYEWYVDSAAKSQPIDGRTYIVMIAPDDERGTSYPDTKFFTVRESGDNYTITRNGEADDYQSAVDAASKQADGTTSIQVGTGAYFYLPSLRPYVWDDISGFHELTFTVYYRTSSSDTATVSGAYDELSIQLTQEGTYQFRIVPTNRAGKAMFGYVEDGESGGDTQYKQVEITTDNVWDCANLETFEFTVKYNGPSIEEAEDGDLGYRDLEYTIDDFEVIAVGDPDKKYSLYYFETASGSTPTVEQLREAIDNGTDSTLGTWREIAVYDADNEDAEYNDYEWYRDDSLSFIPQLIGIYKVTIEVSDSKTGDTPVQSYKLINIASDPDTVDVGGGTIEWLQDNVLSVVFLAIGVLCLIGIVVLLLVKPKDAAAVEAEKARKEEIRKKRENRK